MKYAERIELGGGMWLELSNGATMEGPCEVVILRGPGMNDEGGGIGLPRMSHKQAQAFAAAMVRDTPTQSDEVPTQSDFECALEVFRSASKPWPEIQKVLINPVEAAAIIARHRGRDTTALHGLLERAECEMRYAGWNAEQPDNVARKPLYDDVVAALIATPQDTAPITEDVLANLDETFGSPLDAAPAQPSKSAEDAVSEIFKFAPPRIGDLSARPNAIAIIQAALVAAAPQVDLAEVVDCLRELREEADGLMAQLIIETRYSPKPFLPTKSRAWPAMEKSYHLLAKLPAGKKQQEKSM